VALAGIVIDVKPSQSQKALSPIEVTPSGIVTFFKFTHMRNALLPIRETLDGIVIFSKVSLSEKELFPIEVTPSKILTKR